MTIGRIFVGTILAMIAFVAVPILTALLAAVAVMSTGMAPDAFDWLFTVGVFGGVLAGVGCFVAYITRGGKPEQPGSG